MESKVTKMLGLVTLYKMDPTQAAENIKLYINDLDELIIWDNSPLVCNNCQTLLPLLKECTTDIIWHGTGQNEYITPAINYAWHYATANNYDLLLIMDQDSKWADFRYYRKQVEEQYQQGNICAYTPYIAAGWKIPINESITYFREFINSGTVLPIEILNAINGADKIFTLDCVDSDIAFRISEKGYKAIRFNACILFHSLGNQKEHHFWHIRELGYAPQRVYSIIKAHLILCRRHYKLMTREEICLIIRVWIIGEITRICLVEKNKYALLRSYTKALIDGFKTPTI